jgi:hypothetical protein
MFDPGGVGEWSPPPSPFGGFRGKKKIITSAMVALFVHSRRAKGAA